MGRFLAGAALTALMTVAISGIVAGKVYVPVSVTNAGVAEAAPAQQAPTATPIGSVTLAYPPTGLISPSSVDKPVDGPLAIAVAYAITPAKYTPYSLDETITLTYAGVPLTGQYPTVRLVDPLAYAVAFPSGSCASFLPNPCNGTYVTVLGMTDSQGKVTVPTGISAYYLGATLVYSTSMSYAGHSVNVTRRVLIQ